MLTFGGYELELVVDDVMDGDDGPQISVGHDQTRQEWIIARVEKDPGHLAWLCAPMSPRPRSALLEGRAAAADMLRHSCSDTVDFVLVDHGRAVPDHCLLCADIPGYLLAGSGCRVLVAV